MKDVGVVRLNLDGMLVYRTVDPLAGVVGFHRGFQGDTRGKVCCLRNKTKTLIKVEPSAFNSNLFELIRKSSPREDESPAS